MQLNYKKFKEYDKHKKIIKFEDKENKLKGFIAIHNNNLGPAVGGTRFFPYRSQEEALKDVLRLSHAMTYKCALAGVKYGGGKAVIIGDPQKLKTEKLIRAYAREIGKLKGQFTTGEDVGISEEDVQIMLEESPFFIGKKGLAGDPSPYAALSTYYALKSACKHCFGKSSLKDVTVAVKGIGKVGSELVRLLCKEGSRVYVADINRKTTISIKRKFPEAKIVNPKVIHKLKVEVYAPCALGNEFTDITKNQIKAKIICGAANNQLSSREIGDWFFENGILYIPDYVANAGGLINVVDEMEPGGYNKKRVDKRIKNIKETVSKIIELSEKKKVSTVRISDEIAIRKIKI
jgi:leucine dehydrogenase